MFHPGHNNPTDQPLSPYIQVTEIGLEGQSKQQIPIIGIIGENTTDATLTKLIDEQSSLQIPPSYMSKMYFDEVYFARAAENYVNHQIPHERTHPPLGKLIQAMGVAVFGETPFGWRIMGVLFATLMIPLIYLLGKKLFGTWIGGFSAAFLLAFDFMHFTMARIGTVDTYVAFFSLLSQLFFLIYFMNVVKRLKLLFCHCLVEAMLGFS
jgi:predicted membrane-bound dolichyl-phosphate-mannose-protein mannosyltransferase